MGDEGMTCRRRRWFVVVLMRAVVVFAGTGYGSDNSSMGSFGTIGSLWSTSLGTNQAGTIGSGYGKGSFNYRSADVILGSKAVGYGKNSESIVESATSYALSNGGYDEAFKDTYEAGPFYQDHSWRSSASALEDSGSLSFGLENAVSDLMRKSSSALCCC